MARNNDQWKLDVAGRGDGDRARPGDAYISPGFYPSKLEHGRVVPTWNYVTAHVYGELVVHDDPVWIEDLVRRLTGKHEAHRAHPWSVDDAPRAFIEGQLRAIVGVELVVSRIEAKAKLSQNRAAEDVEGVIAGLRERGDPRRRTRSSGRTMTGARPARGAVSRCGAGGQFGLACGAHRPEGGGLAGHQLDLGGGLVQEHGEAAGHDRRGRPGRPGPGAWARGGTPRPSRPSAGCVKTGSVR